MPIFRIILLISSSRATSLTPILVFIRGDSAMKNSGIYLGFILMHEYWSVNLDQDFLKLLKSTSNCSSGLSASK